MLLKDLNPLEIASQVAAQLQFSNRCEATKYLLTSMQLNISSVVKICSTATFGSSLALVLGERLWVNSHSNCWFSSAFDLYLGMSDCIILSDTVS